LEAEDAKLAGYRVIEVTPWEDASRGKAVTCEGEPRCTAQWTWHGSAGSYHPAVQYFDLQGGAARFTFLLNGHLLIGWKADDVLPSRRPNGDNSTRFSALTVNLKPGDLLSIEGMPDGSDPAALDYIELTPATPPM
jgi:alpha-glucuronidase